MSGVVSPEESKPVRTKSQRALQVLTLIARASQAVYWVHKLWELF
ncbi:hypothetical protein [Streptomyces canus]|nr:hypothetical protein [Streptomyces canus]WSD92730.1 hypothetical protein OG925_51710 [Streptomyces canus]